VVFVLQVGFFLRKHHGPVFQRHFFCVFQSCQAFHRSSLFCCTHFRRTFSNLSFFVPILLFSMSFESVSSGPLNIPWPLPASKLESPSLQLFTASEPVRRSLGSIVVVYGLRLNGYSCRNEYKRWVFFA
jgi:hypothetical protein